jgi:UDP-glucose 6-dehydrogenase
MREAPSRVLLRQLIDAGATVAVYDPVAMAEAKRVLALDLTAGELARVRFADSPMDALTAPRRWSSSPNGRPSAARTSSASRRR